MSKPVEIITEANTLLFSLKYDKTYFSLFHYIVNILMCSTLVSGSA